MSGAERWAAAWAERDRLLRIARHRLPTLEDAEDVVAEAIARAGAADDVPIEAVPAWVTRVTTNLCVDRQRRLRTQRLLLGRAELRPDDVPSPELDAVDEAEARWLASLLEAMPTRQALALRLRAEGYSNTLIAERLGHSVATVEGLVKRSRAALRAAARAAGAAVLAVGLQRRWGPRAALAGVVAASLVLVLIPFSPGEDQRSPLYSQPLPTGAHPEGIASTLPPRTEPVAATAATGSAPKADSTPHLGVADAEVGADCLAPYCLPIVDRDADKAFGSRHPRGWSPRDLWDYVADPAVRPAGSSGAPIVAVVGLFRFDWIANDFAVYRRTFHLPTCTGTPSCLTVLHAANNSGTKETLVAAALQPEGSVYARTAGLAHNGNHAAEQAQLIQNVAAACPECRIVLVQAYSDLDVNVAEAYRTARSVHADAIVSAQDVPAGAGGPLPRALASGSGLLVNASGVGGYLKSNLDQQPSNLPGVIDAGGIGLDRRRVVAFDENQPFCRPSAAPPTWQMSISTGCAGRAGIDLVAPAGAGMGLAVYVTGGLTTRRGWYHPGHNIQAAAVVAGLLARHGMTKVVHGPGELYLHPEWFRDVQAGSVTGTECVPQICSARRGWDYVTGLGELQHLPWM